MSWAAPGLAVPILSQVTLGGFRSLLKLPGSSGPRQAHQVVYVLARARLTCGVAMCTATDCIHKLFKILAAAAAVMLGGHQDPPWSQRQMSMDEWPAQGPSCSGHIKTEATCARGSNSVSASSPLSKLPPWCFSSGWKLLLKSRAQVTNTCILRQRLQHLAWSCRVVHTQSAPIGWKDGFL